MFNCDNYTNAYAYAYSNNIHVPMGGVGGNSGILRNTVVFMIGYESYRWDMW
jgi:hypothetical protein